jgi:hypothetical protein
MALSPRDVALPTQTRPNPDTLCPRRYAETFCLRRYVSPSLTSQKRPDGFQGAQIDEPSFLLSHGALTGMIEPAGQRLEP